MRVLLLGLALGTAHAGDCVLPPLPQGVREPTTDCGILDSDWMDAGGDRTLLSAPARIWIRRCLKFAVYQEAARELDDLARVEATWPADASEIDRSKQNLVMENAIGRARDRVAEHGEKARTAAWRQRYATWGETWRGMHTAWLAAEGQRACVAEQLASHAWLQSFAHRERANEAHENIIDAELKRLGLHGTRR